MDWFKRYSIPGICFIGLLTLWSYALFPGFVTDLIKNENMRNLLIASVGLFFVPIGYLICTLQQAIYLIWLLPRIGTIGKAMELSGKLSRLDFKKEKEYKLEAQSCIWAIQDSDTQLKLEKQKFIQAWLRSRNDILVINNSLITGAILLILGALIAALVKVSLLENRTFWIILALLCSFIVIITASFSSCPIRKQNEKLLTELYMIMDENSYPY